MFESLNLILYLYFKYENWFYTSRYERIKFVTRVKKNQNSNCISGGRCVPSWIHQNEMVWRECSDRRSGGNFASTAPFILAATWLVGTTGSSFGAGFIVSVRISDNCGTWLCEDPASFGGGCSWASTRFFELRTAPSSRLTVEFWAICQRV